MSEQTGFDKYFAQKYKEGVEYQFQRNDLRMAWEEGWRISMGLVELGVMNAWKEGYVVGFNEGKTHEEVSDGNTTDK
jgi:ribosome modulation factor